MIDIPTLRNLFQMGKDDEVIQEYLDTNYEPPKEDMRGKYNQFLATFNTVMKKNHRYTQAMAKKLKTRLKTFTMEEILRAVETMAQNDFYTGDNDRGWVAKPEYILRDDSKIDGFLNSQPIEKKGFVEPSKLEAIEIRLIMQLITGGCEDEIVSAYKSKMMWMKNNDKTINVVKTGYKFAEWLLRDSKVITNLITDHDNLRCYRKYLKTVQENTIEPLAEIVEMGNELQSKLYKDPFMEPESGETPF